MTPEIPTRSYVLGEFATGDALCQATYKVRERGHSDLDLYTPYPIHGTSEALGLPPSKVPLIALTGGVIGALTAFTMQYGLNGILYPINVAGRPLMSLPTFVPVMFELTILLTGLSIFFGLMALSRLPRLSHPVFDAEAFRSASTHAFWISVGTEAEGAVELERSLRELGATSVAVVQEAA